MLPHAASSLTRVRRALSVFSRSYNAFAVCIPMFLLVTYAVFRWGATHIMLWSGAYFMAYAVLVMSGEDMRVVWRHHKNATHKRHELELCVAAAPRLPPVAATLTPHTCARPDCVASADWTSQPTPSCSNR